MFDQSGYEDYVRQRISLERELEEIGDYRGSREIEIQMRNVEDRLLAKIKQAYFHSTHELNALKMILLESTKDKEEEE
jgi:hypothetical protein